MKGLWILPSRRRLAKLAVFFEHATRNGMTTPGVVLVQKDEFAELRDEYAAVNLPANWKILPTNADGMGDKYREIWPAVQGLDWVGIACDDLRVQTPQWDEKLLAAVNCKNVVTCADGVQNAARMSGITVFSGGLLRAIGYIYPENFWHTYVDNCWEDLGRATNCWTYLDSVTVTHDHPFTNQQLDPAKSDDTTLKSYGRQVQDHAAYINWKSKEFPSICERIKAL